MNSLEELMKYFNYGGKRKKKSGYIKEGAVRGGYRESDACTTVHVHHEV